MSTIGHRVKEIITYHGMTVTSFAKELNISQSMVSKICTDKAAPSDRTISDICRTFHINKEWLLKEEGCMVNKASIEAEIYNHLAGTNINESALRKIVSAFASTPPTVWYRFEEILSEQIEGCINNPNIKTTAGEAYQAGYEAGIRAAQEYQKEEKLCEHSKKLVSINGND